MILEVACLGLGIIIAVELKFIFWILARQKFRAENARMKNKVLESFGR